MTLRFRGSPLDIAIENISWEALPARFRDVFHQQLSHCLWVTVGRPRARSRAVARLLRDLRCMIDVDDEHEILLPIYHALGVADERWRRAPRGAVSRLAESLVDFAVGVLPPGDRERYREEFQSEMYELGQREQVLYGFRQLIRSLALRWSLTPLRASASTGIGWRLILSVVAVAVVTLAIVGFVNVSGLLFG